MEMGSQSHEASVEEEEEEYIYMEINPYYSSSSSPQSKDFEFQHLSSDLFYRGKLRRPPPSTPSDSCNISPSQSCRPSCDIPTFTFFFHNSNNNNNNGNEHPPRNNNSNNNSLSKIKKLNKRSYLAHKLKSSRAFLKSLFFTKQSSKPSTFRQKLATFINKNAIIDDHRRSFSGAIASSDSSSSSSASSSFNEVQFLRRSSSAAEIEVSIDAAIAHCKQSHATN